MGGDFKCVLSQQDRKFQSKTPLSEMGKILKYLSAEASVADIKRSKHPKGRDFTFYSNRHASFSRFDYFFTPITELHRVEDITIMHKYYHNFRPCSGFAPVGCRPDAIF